MYYLSLLIMIVILPAAASAHVRPQPAWVLSFDYARYRSYDAASSEDHKSIVAVRSEQADGVAAGTGVVMGSTEVVTACHVLRDAKGRLDKTPTIHKLKDPRGDAVYPALETVLVERNESRDLCLLFSDGLLLDGPSAKPVVPGTTGGLRPRDEVYVISTPVYLGLAYSTGSVSQLRGCWRYDPDTCQGEEAPLLQVDVTTTRGSSGGGLFAENGTLLGLILHKHPEAAFSMAAPVEWVKHLLKGYNRDRALRRASVKRARAGEYDLAETLAGQIVDKYVRASAFSSIAQERARKGELVDARGLFGVALQLVGDVDGKGRGRVLARIARRQAYVGLCRDATRTLAQIHDVRNRDFVLSRVSRCQAVKGLFNDANDTIARISSSSRKAKAAHFVVRQASRLSRTR